MKKSLFCLFVAIIAILVPTTIQAQEYKGLPQNAKTYISKHFKDYSINHYEKDRDILDVEHTVYISNTKQSYKLEFDKNGSLQQIEAMSENGALPNSVLQVKVTEHVKQNFPGRKIVQGQKENNKQKIELDNDMELLFNSKGSFLGIDD